MSGRCRGPRAVRFGRPDVVIDEEQMVRRDFTRRLRHRFFLRAFARLPQGGIEIGFQSKEAL